MKTQLGSTILEALIAVVILSMGMFGVMKLQLESMQQTADARFNVIAASKAQTIMDAIAYERKCNDVAVPCATAPFTDANWNMAESAEVIAALSTDTGANYDYADIKNDWVYDIQKSLPNGKASISCANAVCTITIKWTSASAISLNVNANNASTRQQESKFVIQNQGS